MTNQNVFELSKGGMVVDTKVGAMQIGVPPETIKDSMAMNREVPAIYIAPKNLFSLNKMASLIDIEFPCYYNFFIKKKRIKVLCTNEQRTLIQKLMIESLLGPSDVNPEQEYENGKDNEYFPDLRKEMDYFAKHPELNRPMRVDDLIEFVILDNNQTADINGVQIELNKQKDKIYIHDEKIIELDWNVDYKTSEFTAGEHEKAFIPPLFGITTLGSSHGFDPLGKTSGFIFWINGSGILVDPPIDSSLWLLEENVDPGMINAVILTHCHGDHDAGVMQKILLEGRVKLYTTPTVFSSFVRKISLLTGLSVMQLIDYIEFIPLAVGQAITINGASFIFSYRLHSIPTIGFEVSFNGRSVVYTSDHLNDKNVFEKIYKDGVLTNGRYEELINFNWKHDIVIHEAGVPPMHTPIDILLELPEEIQEKIYLVHTDKSKIPHGSKLSIPESGLDNTMVLDVNDSLYGESVQILNLVSSMDIFEDLRFIKAHEFLSIIDYESFNKGDVLIEQGEQGKKFFIIVSGHATIEIDNKVRSILRSGCYFGENSLITGENTTGRIIAKTELLTLTINRDDFIRFISNTYIFSRLKKLGNVRAKGSWLAIEANAIFSKMTINQKNHLETLFEYKEPEKGELIIKQGLAIEFAVLWHKGNVKFTKNDESYFDTACCGYFLGSPAYCNAEIIPDFNLIAGDNSSYFKINLEELIKFYYKNPGLMLTIQSKTY